MVGWCGGGDEIAEATPCCSLLTQEQRSPDFSTVPLTPDYRTELFSLPSGWMCSFCYWKYVHIFLLGVPFSLDQRAFGPRYSIWGDGVMR